MNHKIAFGFPEFWPTAEKECANFFRQSETFSTLVDSILRAATEKASTRTTTERVIYSMSRATANSFTEVITLIGNGCGLGAMKLARSMFESTVMVEYLRTHPHEVKDYLDYGHVQSWKRYQQLKADGAEKGLKPEVIKSIEKDYARVKTRFTKNGRVRGHWHKKPIAQMAEDIGMKAQYDLPYSYASSLHHSNFEGLTAQFLISEDGASMQQPPSLRFLKEALSAGHAYLLQTLLTLNEGLSLEFENDLKEAETSFHNIWQSESGEQKS